ncbi:MAG: ABC transporter ATP-binding protein [Candidatus Nealsonbacteria bacterium]|nr:ABC transporter ATP-binding protein [Candidatus Nealsonbacteria bacterium]
MIEVRNIKKTYNGIVPTKALDGVSFDIAEGEFVAIMGPSGCGKSTLMHIMGFLDKPSSGTYKLKGRSMDDFNDDELARIRNKEMGFVFQSFNLLARTSVLENVKLPLTYSGLSSEMEDKLAIKALEAVDLSKRAPYLSNQLSGGEQQRVAIARAIVNHPSVIFADEPTGNLDSKSGQQIMDILQKINDEGRTIILVTHEKYTSEMAKRLIQLKDGKIVSDEKIAYRRLAKDGLIK